MGRPTLVEMLPTKQKTLAANMMYYNEPHELIFKYIDMEDSLTARRALNDLLENLESPMSEALYTACLNLAEIEYIISVAADKAQTGSPHHMTRFKQLSELRIKVVNQIDDLMAKEEERGHNWEPTFDLDSPEYRIFKAAIRLFLEQKEDEKDDFNDLKPEEQARFYQILAESA